MGTIKLFIYGASGHGKVVYDVAKRAGYKVLGFIDDNPDKTEMLGLKVLRFEEVCGRTDSCVALGIGNNTARQVIYRKLLDRNVKVVSVIDPTAVLSEHSIVKTGSVVFPNAVVNNSAYIGHGCIINTGAIVEHDCILGDFVHISPNAALAGGVKIGRFSQVGIGACVKQNITVGENVIVGAGAVVVKDIPDNVVVVGNPARILRKNEL